MSQVPFFDRYLQFPIEQAGHVFPSEAGVLSEHGMVLLGVPRLSIGTEHVC